MEKGNLSRRGFLERSLLGMAAAGLPLWFAREELAAAEAKAEDKKGSANSRIALGIIGVGSPHSRGLQIYNDAKRHKGTEFVAVCDVDKGHVERAAKIIGGNCKQFKDYRELLDQKDIDAVLIATPDHWHTLIALESLRKKKDVYCEKPLTLTIDEGKVLVKAAKDTDRIFQVGSQQRSDGRFRLACELVRNGRLGKLKTVETRIGGNPAGTFKTSAVPDGLDWDFWLGPTPKVDYVKQRCHYDFRWWYDYSGGKMTDWGAHHNDIAQWGLGMDDSGPVAVESEGDAPSKEPNSYNCHPRFKVTYTYANGVKLICQSEKRNGVRFEGEDGKWIFVDRGHIEASDKKLLDEKLPENAIRLYVSNNHMGNFLDGIRTRKPTICPAQVGHRSVSVCHMGVISLRTGKKLKWDPVKEQFDDAEANKMLSRPMRGPWKLEG